MSARDTVLLTLTGLCIGGLAITSLLNAQPTFSTIKTVHFEVKYQRGISEEDARKAAEYLQEDYNYMSDKLGLDFKKRLEVRIYDSVGKYLSETNQKRPWRGAIFQRSILHVQPIQALVARKIFEQTLSFEAAMALLEQTSGKGCPRWLRESFAVYHSGAIANLTPPIGAKLASFSDLDQDIQEYPNPPQRDDVHYILGHTMTFFVEKYGEKKSLSLFRTFNGMTPIEEVFKKAFNQEFLTIERTWANYIAAQTEPFKE
jgi:hypothetical protein